MTMTPARLAEIKAEIAAETAKCPGCKGSGANPLAPAVDELMAEVGRLRELEAKGV